MEITQNNAEILRASQGNPEIWTRPVWTFGIADLGNIRFISFCFEHVGQDKSGQGITGTIYNPFTQIPCERYLSASCNVDSLILFEYMKEHKKMELWLCNKWEEGVASFATSQCLRIIIIPTQSMGGDG